MKKLWFVSGVMTGLASLSVALGAVPTRRSVITDDTALYQKLSEIRAARQAKPDFDADIAHLANLESRYREKLPKLARDPRVAGPMKRISQQRYRYSGAPQKRKNVASKN